MNSEYESDGVSEKRGVGARRDLRQLWIFLVLYACLNAGAETVLLKNATVHTVTGQAAQGDVLIDGGKIREVGQVTSKADRVVDLNGLHLYPGMIALDTVLGLDEIAGVRATRDYSEVGEFVPDVESWTAVNPDSELLPVARANGIAYFEPTPDGGVVTGQSSLEVMDGWTTEQMVFKKPVALHVNWPPMELDNTPKKKRDPGAPALKSIEDQARECALKIQALEEFFDDARAYSQARDAAQKSGAPDPGLNPSWEAMRPYVTGQLPIMVHADYLRQIKAAIRWAATNDFKIIISGGRDAWMVSGDLAKLNIPVVYDSVYTLPTRDFESYDVHFKAPSVLQKAGVKVIFGVGMDSMAAAIAKNLPYDAAQAVAFGLPADEALKGLTLYPAQILGVSGRLGSIEPGKDATLFAVDRDILDLRGNVKHLWIAGKEISLESRHTRLYDKYKNRPKE